MARGVRRLQALRQIGWGTIVDAVIQAQLGRRATGRVCCAPILK
jgi:hypothetical protein